MTAREPFDMEKEAFKVYPYDSEHRDAIIAYGRRCADEAYERAAITARECHPALPCPPWVDCQRNIERKILALKSASEEKGKPKGFCKEPDCGGH